MAHYNPEAKRWAKTIQGRLSSIGFILFFLGWFSYFAIATYYLIKEGRAITVIVIPATMILGALCMYLSLLDENMFNRLVGKNR